MVTCQSANHLKTPPKVSWAFKMVSQFGSLGYTIMGKTADLICWGDWFGVQCHLLVLVHCVFWKPTSLHRLPINLEHFMLPSADHLFKDADFIFQQDLAPAHTAKSTKSWLNDHGVGVLDWPANSPDLNPVLSRGKWEKRDQKCKWAEGHCQRNLGFHTTSAVPQTDHLHATPNRGSN